MRLFVVTEALKGCKNSQLNILSTVAVPKTTSIQ